MGAFLVLQKIWILDFGGFLRYKDASAVLTNNDFLFGNDV